MKQPMIRCCLFLRGVQKWALLFPVLSIHPHCKNRVRPNPTACNEKLGSLGGWVPKLDHGKLIKLVVGVLATAIATALIFLRGNMELEWRRPGVDWSFTFPLTVDDVGACRGQFRDLSPTCLKPLPSTTFCLESKRYTNALFPRNDTVKFHFRF